MTFEHKKEHVLRCVRLGMELFRAQLVAECTPEEIERMESDPSFLAKVEQQYAVEEYDLLKKHSTAMEIAIAAGKTAAIQWKLGKLNPIRWGNDEGQVLPPDLPNLRVNLVGVSNDDGS